MLRYLLEVLDRGEWHYVASGASDLPLRALRKSIRVEGDTRPLRIYDRVKDTVLTK